MQEYSALWSKVLFKETGFIFHIFRESFKPVRLFRKIAHLLFFKNALVCSKAAFSFLFFFFWCGFNFCTVSLEIPIRDEF